jgi:peptide/nickel transport system permease protein
MGLKEYVVVRVLLMIPVVLILLTFVFVVVHIIPGDPVRAIVGEQASEEYVEAVRHQLGLDKPLHEQYLDYLGGLITGNMGKSYTLNRSVFSIIQERMGVTIQLSIIAWILSIAIGLPTGLFASLKAGKFGDQASQMVALAIYSSPVFVTGILAQLIFGKYLGILPVFGTHSAYVRPPRLTGLILFDTLWAGDFAGFFDSLSHFILPALVLAARYGSYSARFTRSETVKAMKRMYCLVAEAKGLKKTTITFRHAFRTAIIPVVTLIGMQAGFLLTGSILVETVFSLPGLGSLLQISASQRDYLLVQGVITYFVVIILAIGLLIDISYYFLDPRVKY